MPHGHAIGVPDEDPERTNWAMQQMLRQDHWARIRSKVVFCEPCVKANHTECGKVCVRPCECSHGRERS